MRVQWNLLIPPRFQGQRRGRTETTPAPCALDIDAFVSATVCESVSQPRAHTPVATAWSRTWGGQCAMWLEFGKRKRRVAGGARQQEYVETAYETLPKEEIESIKPHVELIRFVSGTRRGQSRTLASYLLAATCVAAAVYLLVIR